MNVVIYYTLLMILDTSIIILTILSTYHLDAVKESSANSTKGTLIINVSDSKYTGGELLYWNNGGEIHIDHLDKPGSMVYLRPHMYHKIKPVRSGIRKSIAIFLTSPKWR